MGIQIQLANWKFYSDEYVSLVESTAQMTEEQLKKLSSQYDSVYFHPVGVRVIV